MACKAISNPILVLDEQAVPCAESTNTIESFGYRAAALESAGQRGNTIDVLIGGGSQYFPLWGRPLQRT